MGVVLSCCTPAATHLPIASHGAHQLTSACSLHSIIKQMHCATVKGVATGTVMLLSANLFNFLQRSCGQTVRIQICTAVQQHSSCTIGLFQTRTSWCLSVGHRYEGLSDSPVSSKKTPRTLSSTSSRDRHLKDASVPM